MFLLLFFLGSGQVLGFDFCLAITAPAGVNLKVLASGLCVGGGREGGEGGREGGRKGGGGERRKERRAH